MEVARQRGGGEEATEPGERGKFAKYFHHMAKRDTLLDMLDGALKSLNWKTVKS